MLTVGDKVLDRDGNIIDVLWVWEHTHRKEEMVLFTTISQTPSSLHVTSCHRIVKKSVDGEEVELAKNVKNDDWIIVGEEPEQVKVESYTTMIRPIEIGFQNDASVEAWNLNHGIVTKGQAVDDSYNARIPCKHEEEVKEDADDSHNAPIQFRHEEAEEAEGEEVADNGGRRSRRSRRRYKNMQQRIGRYSSPGDF